MKRLREYSGFPFPAVKQGPRGPLCYVTEDTRRLVKSSLLTILLTAPGEREWCPTFGCKAHLMLFDAASPDDLYTIQSLVLEAITTWEPRVELTIDDIAVSLEDNHVFVQLTYRIVTPTVSLEDSLSVTL